MSGVKSESAGVKVKCERRLTSKNQKGRRPSCWGRY